MENNNSNKYSALKAIAIVYRFLPLVIALTAVFIIIVLKTSWIMDLVLVLSAIFLGINLFAVAELIKLFISNEQGIRKTNYLLNKLIDEIKRDEI